MQCHRDTLQRREALDHFEIEGGPWMLGIGVVGANEILDDLEEDLSK